MKSVAKSPTSYFSSRRMRLGEFKNFRLPFWLTNNLPSDRTISLLDVGCGYGQVLTALRKYGYRNIYGIDLSATAVEHCLSKDMNVIFSDFHDFESKLKFDVIIMLHVIEHIEKNLIIPALVKARNMLKNKGRLFVSVPNAQSNTGAYWAFEDFTHSTLFTSGSLYYVLSQAGFEDIRFLDIDCTEGMAFFKKLIRKTFLQIYKAKLNFWNQITCSSWHLQSENVFSFEIKAIAKK